MDGAKAAFHTRLFVVLTEEHTMADSFAPAPEETEWAVSETAVEHTLI